jgi:Tfp pilus assembly protein PilF
LSRAIAEEIRITVGTKENRRLTAQRTVKPEAYDAYLLGRHHWDQRTEVSLERALAYFQTAIATDPDFALAHAGLAMAYAPRLIFGYLPPGRGLSEQKAAALKALELDPGLGDARAALAAARAQEWDWDGAEAEFRSAVETDPSSTVAHLWYGWFLHALGRFDESLAQRRRALELDPLNGPVNRGVARDLVATGRDAEAVAQWQRVLELEPSLGWTHLHLALFRLERGETGAASRDFERARSLAPGDASTLAFLGIVSTALGDRQEGRRMLGQLKAESARRYISPVLPALVHAALDEKDTAFALLEEAYAARDPMLIPIQVGEAGPFVHLPKERLAALRADPRFHDLLRRMGFAPAIARK